MEDSLSARQQFQCPSCGFTIFNRRYPKCERCGLPIPDTFKYSNEQIQEITEASFATTLARIAEQIKVFEWSVGGGRFPRATISLMRSLFSDCNQSLLALEQLCAARERDLLRCVMSPTSDNVVCTSCQRPILSRRHGHCVICGHPIPPNTRLTPEQQTMFDEHDQRKLAIRTLRERIDAAAGSRSIVFGRLFF